MCGKTYGSSQHGDGKPLTLHRIARCSNKQNGRCTVSSPSRKSSARTMRPLFILGNNRSGTSLFRLMLNGHSKIVIPPESHFFLWWYDTYWDWTPKDGFDAILRDIRSSTKFETWELDMQGLRKALETQPPRNYPELVQRIYLAYALDKDPLYWGDKNSLWVEKFDVIRTAYPDVIVLHLVRNGLDVACSYKDLAQKALTTTYAPKLTAKTEEIAYIWSTNNEALAAFGEQLGKARYRCIRFEDLLVDPKKTLSEVLAFLALEFEDAMLDYHRTPLDEFKEPQAFMAWKAKLREAPDASSVNKYMQELTKEEIDLFRHTAGDALTKFGYQ